MRLYFHLQDEHEEIRDLDGAEVSDLIEARAQVLRAIKELRLEDKAATQAWSGWVLTITDADGTALLDLEIAHIL